MDKNKVAEKIAKEREKAKNLGKTMWVFTIINSFSDEFINKLNMGEEKEKMIPRIYSRTLINRALSLYGKNPEDLEGIYWKLMASCTGESIAKSVCENPMLLELYLKMESEGISDLVIAAKFTRIFNQWQE
jgi:hypothetical protein